MLSVFPNQKNSANLSLLASSRVNISFALKLKKNYEKRKVKQSKRSRKLLVYRFTCYRVNVIVSSLCTSIAVGFIRYYFVTPLWDYKKN